MRLLKGLFIIYKLTFKALWISQSRLYWTFFFCGLSFQIGAVILLWPTSAWLALGVSMVAGWVIAVVTGKLMNMDTYLEALEAVSNDDLYGLQNVKPLSKI